MPFGWKVTRLDGTTFWANLSGADLSGAFLSGAYLRWTDLSGWRIGEDGKAVRA